MVSRADRPQSNATAERAIDVLLLFDEDSPILSANDIATALDMSRSTTYRYIQSLRLCGLLEEDQLRGGFRLGPRIFLLARIARIGQDLPEIALPIMRELAAETDETVLLTRRVNDEVICVERVNSSHPIRLAYERGHVLPPYAGASAKVLLAFSPPSEVDAVLFGLKLQRLTPHTVRSLRELRGQLATIREAGYSVSDGEVDVGVRGIAAPIIGESGDAVAGLSVAGPAFRLPDDVVSRVVEAVCAAADRIGIRLRDIQDGP